MENSLNINIEQEEIVVELPGVTRGLQGEQGEQGIQGVRGPQGYHVKRVDKKNGTSEPGTTDTYEVKINDDDETVVGEINVYNGNNGIYKGSEEPSSDKYEVWIDENGETDTIPTKISQLTNDNGYIKKDVNNLINYYNKTELDAKIGFLSSLKTTDKTSLVNAINEIKSSISSIVNGDEVEY